MIVNSLPRDATQSTVLPWQIVRPSVTLGYRGHIGWNFWKRLISVTFPLSADPNITDLFQREHLQILAGLGVG